MEKLTGWLYNTMNQMSTGTIKSITGNHQNIKAFNASLIN